MQYQFLYSIHSPEDLKQLSVSQLSILAQEIRDFLIINITQTGGHLAPNLGVVELTIALHYVFDSPKDSFIWDVGHQSYVHKILTGRWDLFSTLRKKNGLSGYPSPQESVHDIVHAGHSSTSVSLGVGIASAKRMDHDSSATIAVIGDGSFTSGMVYEALNDISWRNVPLFVVLNDNKMSISENVGGIAKHLHFLRANKTYLRVKKNIYSVLEKTTFGNFIAQLILNFKSSIKKFVFYRQNMFENLGVRYLGPFDGHNLGQLISLFRQMKTEQGPLLLHIITEKGLGHHESQSNPINFHGISGIDDSIPISSQSEKSWSKVFGEIVCFLVEEDSRLVLLTAAMREGTGLLAFSKKFPDHFIDVGIAEQHAVACAVGFAIQGRRPIVAIYSTFLQRAYDQVLHDAAIGDYPVIFCLDRAGLVPGDGKTHQGVFDIAYLRMIPNMIVMSPLSEIELSMMLRFALTLQSPVSIRYPKDICPKISIPIPPIILGQGFEIHHGSDGVIVIFGSLIDQALDTVKLLKEYSKNYAVYHLRFAKPISSLVLDYLETKTNIIVLEEGIEFGGIGEYLKNQLLERNSNLNIILNNVGDVFPSTDTREGLLDEFGFTSHEIVQKILEL